MPIVSRYSLRGQLQKEATGLSGALALRHQIQLGTARGSIPRAQLREEPYLGTRALRCKDT
jgi:hypothetical protein